MTRRRALIARLASSECGARPVEAVVRASVDVQFDGDTGVNEPLGIGDIFVAKDVEFADFDVAGSKSAHVLEAYCAATAETSLVPAPAQTASRDGGVGRLATPRLHLP